MCSLWHHTCLEYSRVCSFSLCVCNDCCSYELLFSHTHTHKHTQTHRGRLASTQRHHSTPSPQVHQLFPPAGLSWSQTLASHQRVFRLLWLALSQLADHREAGQGSGSRGKVARLHRGPFHLFSNPPRVGKRLVLLSWLFDEGQLPLITFTEKEKHVKS